MIQPLEAVSLEVTSLSVFMLGVYKKQSPYYIEVFCSHFTYRVSLLLEENGTLNRNQN